MAKTKAQAAFESHDELPDDAQTRRAHVRNTCLALSLHAQLEDEVFHPALRERLDDPSLVEEAMVEHPSARELIDQLAQRRTAMRAAAGLDEDSEDGDA